MLASSNRCTSVTTGGQNSRIKTKPTLPALCSPISSAHASCHLADCRACPNNAGFDQKQLEITWLHHSVQCCQLTCIKSLMLCQSGNLNLWLGFVLAVYLLSSSLPPPFCPLLFHITLPSPTSFIPSLHLHLHVNLPPFPQFQPTLSSPPHPISPQVLQKRVSTENLVSSQKPTSS